MLSLFIVCHSSMPDRRLVVCSLARVIISGGTPFPTFFRMNLAIFSSLVSGILLLAFWIPLSTAPAIIGFSVVYGFFAGLFISLIPACIGQISHHHEVGLRLGLAWGIASVFALFGPPISGALISNYGGGAKGYEMAGVFSGVVVLAGTVFAAGSRFCLNREVFAVM